MHKAIPEGEFRNEDVTLNMILARVLSKVPEGESIEDYNMETVNNNWNTTCDEIIKEFEDEGLTTSAKFVRKYKVK